MLLHPHVLTLNTIYRDDENALSIRTSIAPGTLRLLSPPPLTMSLSRRLFRESLTQGNLTFNITPQPVVSLNILSPAPFDLSSESYAPPMDRTDMDSRSKLASVSGFNLGTHYSSYGFTLDSVNPRLTGEWGVTFSELALQVKLGLEFGLNGLAWMCGGSWANDTSEVAATVNLSHSGVVMTLESVHFAPYPFHYLQPDFFLASATCSKD